MIAAADAEARKRAFLSLLRALTREVSR
jgi:hypothetical protein